MAGFDLGSLLQNATQLLGLQTQLGNKQIQEMEGIQGDYEDVATQQERSGLLGSQVKRAELMGKFETEQARLQAAVAAGTSVGAQSDILTPMLASLREQAGAFTAAQAKVSEIEANSDIINNPLGWLRDLVQGDQARAQRDAVASKFDATTKQVAALNAATQQTAATQNAIQTTLTAASIDQMAEQQVIDAQIKATETRMNGKLLGIEAIKVAREMGSENFRLMHTAYSLQTDDERYREGAALRREQFESLKAARRDREKDEEYYAEQTENVNRYLRQIGRPELPVHYVKNNIQGGGANAERVMEWNYRGAELAKTGGLMRVYGDTSLQTLNAVVRDKVQLPPAYESGAVAVMKEIDTAARTALQAVGATAYGKDPASYATEYEKAEKAITKKHLSDIQPGSKNPYQAPNISTVLAERPEIAESKFGKLILSGLAATGKDETNPELIMAMTAKAVQNKELTMSEAAMSYAYYFKEAVTIRDATKGFMATALPTSPGYLSKIEALEPTVFQRFGSAGAGLAVMPLAGYTAAQLAASNLPGANTPEGGTFAPGQYHRALEHTMETDVTLGLTLMMSKNVADSILSAKPK